MVSESRVALAFVAVLCSGMWLSGEEGSGPLDRPFDETNPLYTWRAVRTEFQKVGALLVRDEERKADEQLKKLEASLPKPYGETAAAARHWLNDRHYEKVDSALGVPADAQRLLSRRLAHLAQVASDLEDHASAARLYESAVNADPDCFSYMRTGWASSLLANMATVDECAKAVGKEAKYHEGQGVLERARRYQEKRDDPDFWLNENMFGILTRLWHLEQMEPKLPSEEWRARYCLQRASLLHQQKDFRGQHAWEEKLLADFPHETKTAKNLIWWRTDMARGVPDDFELQLSRCRRVFPNQGGQSSAECVKLLLFRTQLLLNEADLPATVDALNRIQKEFPLPAQEPLLSEVGTFYRRAGAHRQAIDVFERILAAIPEPEEEPQERGPFFPREEKPKYAGMDTVLAGLTDCYEAIGKPDRALYYFNPYRRDCPYRGTCGTGHQWTESYRASTAARLTFAMGKVEEAVNFVEPVMLGTGEKGYETSDAWFDLFVRVIHYRRARGEIEALREKIAKARERAEKKLQEFREKEPSTRAADMKDYFLPIGVVFAEEYLKIFEHARQVGRNGLWAELKPATVVPNRHGSPAVSWKDQLLVRIFLTGDADRAAGFLREKLRGSDSDRALASVLLGKLGHGVDSSLLRLWLEEGLTKEAVTGDGLVLATALLDADPKIGAALIRERLHGEEGRFQYPLHETLEGWKRVRGYTRY